LSRLRLHKGVHRIKNKAQQHFLKAHFQPPSTTDADSE
jgi:hypothetical protein